MVAVPVHRFSEAGVVATFERIAELTRLPDDWDSYGGMSPSVKAAAGAAAAVSTIVDAYPLSSTESIMPLGLMPTPSGGIDLVWRTPSTQLTIGVSRSGEYSYLLVRSRDRAPTFDEQDGVPLERAVSLIDEFLPG